MLELYHNAFSSCSQKVRIVLGESNPQHTASMMVQLRKKLPDCEMSYVNLNSTL